MSLHRNRVQMTVTGTPGTGTITLNAATSGYQSFGTAYSSADATVDILITEGTSWEVARNCTYTHSGTTVTRGTLEASSSGSAVSFTSAAIVSVIATAASGNNWGLNEVQSNADAAVTGVVGTMHILDIGPFTADRDFTLPATCAVGDRVGVFIKTGDDAFELLLKPASGDTINGGSAGAEWSRLFISNECVIFRCITANSDWIVEYDGRINSTVLVESDTTTTQTFTRNVNSVVTTVLATEVLDQAAEWDHTNKQYKPRRKGIYFLSASLQMATIAIDKVVATFFRKNGSTTLLYGAISYVPVSASPNSIAAGFCELNGTTDYVELMVYYEDASTNRATIAGQGRVTFQAARLEGS
jgi:hypothetical protein